MIKHGTLLVMLALAAASCGGTAPGHPGTVGGTSGTTGSAGTGGGAAGAGGSVAGATGAAGAAGAAGENGAAGATETGGATGTAGMTATGGAGGGGAGGVSDGGASPDASGGGGAGSPSASDAGPGQSFLPADYKGAPFAALEIPGRINAADYDRGGAGVGWCHNAGACGAGTTTGDWYPGGSAPYRPPIPANAKLCSGAACDDNVGICRMSPNKPDRTSATTPAPPADTYLCYSIAGEWTKYTVVVTQAGTYAVGGFMAVPQGGGVNLSFGATITTGNLTLAVTNPSNCGGGEYFHCWAQRENLATITFPAAGTYLMTLTQTGRFNADNFTFTKM